MHICNGPLQHHKPSHCILMHLQFFKHVLQPLQHIIYSIPKHCFFAFVHSVIFKYSFIYKFLILIFSKSFKLLKKVIMQFITSPNYHHLRTSNILFYLFFIIHKSNSWTIIVRNYWNEVMCSKKDTLYLLYCLDLILVWLVFHVWKRWKVKYFF